MSRLPSTSFRGILSVLVICHCAGSVVAQSIEPPAAGSQPIPPMIQAAPGVVPAIVPFAVQPAPSIVPLVAPDGLMGSDAAPPAIPVAEPATAPIPDAYAAIPGATAAGDAAAPVVVDETQSNPWLSAAGMGGFSAVGPTAGVGASGAGASGFDSLPPGFGLVDTLLEGFGVAATLSGTYDTNPSRGYSANESADEGDFFMAFGATASYRSRASTWTYAANYNGSYSQYFNQTDLSGYNQSAGGSLNYDSGPLNASLNLGINFGSGANRYYASVVDEISYYYGLDARYRLSPKTSLTGNLSQRITNSSGSDGQDRDTESFDLGASALWRYSRLTEFGPGIRYTLRSGSFQEDRSSIGPTMTVNYELSKKVSLNSRVGMDFVEYESGESGDPSLFTSIGLNYRASRLWGMNLSLNRDSQASYSAAGEFEEITALRLGYNRKIRRANLNLGLGWETRTSDRPDGSAAASPDRDYLTIDSSLGMPVFANTCNASIFMRYSDQSGGASESWDSLQTGFSLSRSF